MNDHLRTNPGSANGPADSSAPPLSALESHNRQLIDQIAKLKERQAELVRQTAEEFELLEQRIANNQEVEASIAEDKEPLLHEIRELREMIASLEAEKLTLADRLTQAQQHFQAQHAQMAAALQSLKNIIRGQASTLDQQIRVFSLDATQSLEGMLSSLESAVPTVPHLDFPDVQPRPTTQPKPVVSAPVHLAPAVSRPAPLPAVQPEAPILPAKATPAPMPALAQKAPKLAKTESSNKPKKRSTKKLLVRAVSFCLLVGIGYAGFHSFVGASPVSQATGQVAGASTDARITQPTTTPSDSPAPALDDYKESLADVSYAKTEWEPVVDSDFGISMKYPKNASNRVHTVGSSNYWFLRKNSYLMKITKIELNDSKQTLDQWWEANKSDYIEGNSATKTTFKSLPAYSVQPTDSQSIAGSQYFVKKGAAVFLIWLKSEPATTDDGQRLLDMVTSLQFT